MKNKLWDSLLFLFISQKFLKKETKSKSNRKSREKFERLFYLWGDIELAYLPMKIILIWFTIKPKENGFNFYFKLIGFVITEMQRNKKFQFQVKKPQYKWTLHRKKKI